VTQLLRTTYRGPFAWHAGLEVALLAIRRALDAGATLRADFVGEGPERDRLIYTIGDLALVDAVRVCEPGSDGVGVATEVFLWPVLRAGDPAELRAAMRRGEVAVASDLPAARAHITHGEDGLLAPPRDPVALAEHLVSLWREPDRRARLAATAQRRAQSGREP
jgi:glycosyltransferase involved in cell wall biosynthesis